MHVCSKYIKNKVLITTNSLRSGSAQYQQCLLGPIPHTHTQVVIHEKSVQTLSVLWQHNAATTLCNACIYIEPGLYF